MASSLSCTIKYKVKNAMTGRISSIQLTLKGIDDTTTCGLIVHVPQVERVVLLHGNCV
jgi:hypothetical protein